MNAPVPLRQEMFGRFSAVVVDCRPSQTRISLTHWSIHMFASLLILAGAMQLSGGHGEHQLKCAKVCADCQVACDACFKHCIGLAGEGKKEHAATAQMCADCGECCKVCSSLCARQSALSDAMLACCAECCDRCAASCEKMPEDKHMAQCAKTCRDCAKSCCEMKKMVAKAG
jgi:hypothetical protein